ncbi:MAG: aminotransferase class I/II-fold pyridoxal phosphate-dependent enzyme [Ruminococcus sp.]|nr:aminotransferase class I/II-fold pyridoxal phosphate-dependent enzyme [Ruminococcus sp.]MCI6505668.1 aminotransferase class I/II-fold pyridoxal phosphate-dependent enzyme [Ruminococcus sp.]
MNYSEMTKEQLLNEKSALEKQYEDYKAMNLKLDMSRGKPSTEQLNISSRILDILTSTSDCSTEKGFDCRNYGLMDGITEIKPIFAQMMQVDPDMIMVGGNSSLNMMFDTISLFMTKSPVEGEKPWLEVKNRKFLCPAPGYDRHFGITEYFGFEMITIPMTSEGPDMDMVEKLVAEDDSIKGIWCVPKYSNPQGITYSDETVKRFANLNPKAKDFRIFWDDAYCVHDVTETPDKLISLMDECKKTGKTDLPIIFCSTSKITFPGSGVAAMAADENNMKVIKEKYKYQTISFDKVNMLRHILFFKDIDGVKAHMDKHKSILKPKFDIVLKHLKESVGPTGVATWFEPNGGYFVAVDVMEGTAKKVVQLCKEAGVVLTGAGATYPYGNDPKDSNIRIAPSYPTLDELEKATEIFCVATKLAAVNKILENM